MPYKNFYASQSWIDQVWKEFKQICRREEESPSQKIRKWVEQYNDIHRVGNPQTLVDVKLNLKPEKIQLCHNCPEIRGHVDSKGNTLKYTCHRYNVTVMPNQKCIGELNVRQ